MLTHNFLLNLTNILLAPGFLLLASRSPAATLVSNFDSMRTTSIPSIYRGQWLAQPFTTGNFPAQLLSLRAEISKRLVGPLDFAIHADLNGLPGALLDNGELTPQQPLQFGPFGSEFDRTFLAESLALESNTIYWVLASSNQFSFQGMTDGWHHTRTPDTLSDYGWTIGPGYGFSSDQGATWNYATNRPSLLMELDGLVIPEPSSVLLAGLAAVLMAHCRRRSWT